MTRLLQSFSWALDGLGYTIRTQMNMKIHLGAGLIVLASGLIIGLTRIEWGLLAVTITFVLVAETVNTAIERAVDVATDEFHPVARVAKNVAAGAVLLAAINAVVMGCIIFIPHLWIVWR